MYYKNNDCVMNINCIKVKKPYNGMKEMLREFGAHDAN